MKLHRSKYRVKAPEEKVIIAEQIGAMVLVLDPHSMGVDARAAYLLSMDRETFENLVPDLTKAKLRECTSVFAKIAKSWNPNRQ